MAVVNLKGLQSLTAADNVGAGSSLAPYSLAGGVTRYFWDNQVVTNGDSIASIYKLARVPSNAVLVVGASNIEHDALTGVTSADIGLYNAVTGTVVNVNCLAAAQNLATAGTKNVLASVAIENRYKPLWQLAGLTSDPGVLFDIAVTLNAAATATGDLTIAIQFIA